MQFTKKLFTIATLMIMLGSFSLTPINATETCVDNGGCGYEECTRTSSLAPAIALGAIVLVAVVAVAVQNTSGHSHCHGHH